METQAPALHVRETPDDFLPRRGAGPTDPLKSCSVALAEGSDQYGNEHDS